MGWWQLCKIIYDVFDKKLGFVDTFDAPGFYWSIRYMSKTRRSGNFLWYHPYTEWQP